MSAHTPPRAFLSLQPLEPRETPAALVSDTFDAITTPYLPTTNWQRWASNGQEYYGVGWSKSLSGSQSLAVYGTVNVSSFAWNTTPAPADATVSAAVRDGVPAPVAVYTRGHDLSGNAPSYIGVVLTRGGVIELREVTNGDVRVVSRVVPPAGPDGSGWLRLSLTTRGTTAEVRVQRADAGLYLTAAGTWQAAEAVAVTAAGLAPAQTTTAKAGVGRLPGPYGTAFVDDFRIEPAAAAQDDPPAGTTPPVIPRSYPHIRLAQLAYSATPVGDFEKNLLANSIDLVVSNPKFLQTFDQAAPGKPQLVYSNVSNLYQDLLTDWLAFDRATKADPEAAFFHVTQPTAFQGASASSQPVTWFWGAWKGAADVTAAARGAGTTGVSFGPAGDAVSLGMPDRFREVNVALKSAAGAGWAVRWEYVAAADAAGNPTLWKPLPLLADGTNGLKADGTIEFDPPADWVPAKINGSAALYAVRARTTAGGTAPVAKSLLGRDYVGAAGKPTGTIPAFDYAADKDGDGYLNGAEYAARRAGFDARFASEGRLFYPYYGQMRFAVNPAPAAVKAWAADYHKRLLAQTPLAAGVFIDNENGKAPLGGASVRESAAAFGAESGQLLKAVNAAIAPKWAMANTAGARAEADPVAANTAASFEEFLLRPMSATWSQVGDAADVVARRLNAANPSPYVVIDSLPTGGSPTDPRTQLATLAYYYLLADPDKTFLMFFGGDNPSAPWGQKWTAAAAVNVGRPTGAMATFATGADPANPQLTYKVFSRDYGNALVLYKPKSYALGKGTGTTADDTATTHQLGGSYRAVKADGTLGPVVTSVSLRNGEGVVLMKA